MKVSATEEGVELLTNSAESMNAGLEEIVSAANALESVANPEYMGKSQYDDLIAAINDIKSAIADAVAPASEIVLVLKKKAADYQEIVDNEYFTKHR